MKKVFKLRYILSGLLVIVLVMQIFRIDKAIPETNLEYDYLIMTKPPVEIAYLIKAGCYDCHSNETVYPWYSNLAPISWSIKSHISEGREHLNFSEWGNYQPGKRGNKHDECKEMLVNGEMPLFSYKLIHSPANFNEEQKARLIAWFTNE